MPNDDLLDAKLDEIDALRQEVIRLRTIIIQMFKECTNMSEISDELIVEILNIMKAIKRS